MASLALALVPAAAWGLAPPAGAGALSSRLAILAKPSVRSAPPDVQAKALGLPSHGPGSLLRVGNRVVVEVRFEAGVAAGVEDLRAAGAEIANVSRRYQTATVAAKPDELSALSGVPGVAAATEVLTPMASASTCPSGAVVSEGDTQLRAAEARSAFGVDGAGTTVGILSDSFDRAAGAVTHEAEDIETGDLPGAANTCPGESTPTNLVDDSVVGADEGRGMTQIVHDLAPGASLAFATAFAGETAFAENIEKLAKPSAEGGAGAGVIADDVTYFAEPFFQESLVGVAASKAVAHGVSYFSSAANNNLIDGGGRDIASWEAPSFRNAGSCPAPLGSTECMDFNPGLGTDTTFELTVSPFRTLRLDLQWAEPWEGVATDLDAFLISGGTVVASSLGFNIIEGRPFEFIGWENASASPAHVQLAINRFAGGAPRLKFALLENGSGVTESEYPESSGGDMVGPTIFGHNGGEDVTSAAAIRYNNPSIAPESYSSRGAVTHYFGPVTGTSTPAAPLGGPEVLSKPDLTATDCGVTTFFSFFEAGWRFCGTSAAAPHAAAVAALMLEKEPVLTPEQIRTAMQESATPIGAFGPFAVGAGLVNAVGAIEKADVTAPAAPTISGTDPASPANDNNPKVKGSAESGSTVRVFKSASCSGSVAAEGSAASFASPGLAVSVADNTTTQLSATATDDAGNTSSCSNSISYTESTPPPLPPPPPPPFGIAVAKNVALVKGGKAFLMLTCQGAGACQGNLQLVVRVKSRKGKGKGAQGSKRRVRNLVIGRAGFSIPRGLTETIRVRLTGKGKRLVRRAGRRGLKVKLRGSGVANRTVRLKQKKRRRRH